MATGPTTQIADVVVPEIFTPYVQQLTQEKSRIVQSGALSPDAALNEDLAGGGLTFNSPSFQDLDNDDDRVSTDVSSFTLEAPTVSGSGTIVLDPVPQKIQTSTEIQVRLSRNNSWSSMDLTAALAGVDPMNAIASRVAAYWTRRLQVAFVATMNGVIADNTANFAADYTNDISNGGVFVDGVTNFSAEAFVDTTLTMGDSMENTTMIMVHSVVYGRMQKNNLIDFIPDARGETDIPTFLGREVIVDDGMPNAANVYDTWLFGAAALRLGTGSPKVPTEMDRLPGAGGGGGQEVLYNRPEWVIHPAGHAYVGTPAGDGGPNNTELATATSWNRVFPERKQIAFARLVTTEA